MYVCTITHCRGQRITCSSRFSPYTKWILGTELKLVGLKANVVTYQTIISLTLRFLITPSSGTHFGGWLYWWHTQHYLTMQVGSHSLLTVWVVTGLQRIYLVPWLLWPMLLWSTVTLQRQIASLIWGYKTNMHSLAYRCLASLRINPIQEMPIRLPYS